NTREQLYFPVTNRPAGRGGFVRSEIILAGGQVVMHGFRQRAENKREYGRDGEIEDHRVERGIARYGEAEQGERIDRRFEPERSGHPCAGADAGGPADQKRARIEPARVKAEENGGQGLDDPYATQKLKLDRQAL